MIGVVDGLEVIQKAVAKIPTDGGKGLVRILEGTQVHSPGTNT